MSKYSFGTEGVDHAGQPNSVDKETTDLKTISHLDIDVQRFESLGADKYVLYCNGYDKVGGAQITMKADNFELFDAQDKPLSFEKYESWSNERWTKIQKK